MRRSRKLSIIKNTGLAQFFLRKENKDKMNKNIFKKEGEELQEWLKFRRRGSVVEAKKGKGAKYKRSKTKEEFNKKINSEE